VAADRRGPLFEPQRERDRQTESERANNRRVGNDVAIAVSSISVRLSSASRASLPPPADPQHKRRPKNAAKRRPPDAFRRSLSRQFNYSLVSKVNSLNYFLVAGGGSSKTNTDEARTRLAGSEVVLKQEEETKGEPTAPECHSAGPRRPLESPKQQATMEASSSAPSGGADRLHAGGGVAAGPLQRRATPARSQCQSGSIARAPLASVSRVPEPAPPGAVDPVCCRRSSACRPSASGRLFICATAAAVAT
jgi:hypothetical protein